MDHPLQFSSPGVEEDMEDLTSQLESAFLQPTAPYSDEEDHHAPSVTAPAADDMGSTFATYGQLVSKAPEAIASPLTSPVVTSHAVPLTPPPAPPPLMIPQPQFGNNGPLSPSAAGPLSPLPTAKPPRPLSDEQLLRVTVSQPLMVQHQGLLGVKGSHVSYLITTETNLQGFAKPVMSVRRRFRDFVSLSEVLKARYRGYFLAPRPDKNPVEAQRGSTTFIEDRRVALERYLNRLGSHPVAARGEELRMFLEYESELSDFPLWNNLMPTAGNIATGTAKFSMQLLGLERAVVDPVEATKSTKNSVELLRAWKEAQHSMAHKDDALPADECSLRRQGVRFDMLGDVLQLTGRAAEKLVVAMEKLSSVEGDLGLGLFKIAKYEDTYGAEANTIMGTLGQRQQVIDNCKSGATSLVRISRLTRKATAKCAQDLELIHEHTAFAPAIGKALRTRERQLLTHQTLVDELKLKRDELAVLTSTGVPQQSLHSSLANVFGGDNRQGKKLADAQSDVVTLEQAVVAAKAEYERIKDTNLKELGRVDTDMAGELLDMLRGFTRVCLTASEHELDVWLNLSKDLGASEQQLIAAKTVSSTPLPVPTA